MSNREPITWGYARVSREEQELALQIDALLKAGVAPENLVEEKASGARDDRVKFQALIAKLQPGDTLVAWKLDRLGRSTLRIMELMEKLDKMGVAIKILTMGIDTTTPIGKMISTVMAALAEFERAQIIERTNAGLAASRRRGTVFGRKSALSDKQKEECVMMRRQGKTLASIGAIYGVGTSVIDRAVRHA
jgi:DNA invertase Pin-like site-specific DNA recombinase